MTFNNHISGFCFVTATRKGIKYCSWCTWFEMYFCKPKCNIISSPEGDTNSCLISSFNAFLDMKNVKSINRGQMMFGNMYFRIPNVAKCFSFHAFCILRYFRYFGFGLGPRFLMFASLIFISCIWLIFFYLIYSSFNHFLIRHWEYISIPVIHFYCHRV